MKLVIVESPAKGKTIERFLGRDYEVAASFGHIRDLPRTAKEIPPRLRSQPWARLGVDVDGNFEPVYVIPPESKKHIAALRKKVRNAEEIILATDEDREGESISWHLLEVLKPRIRFSASHSTRSRRAPSGPLLRIRARWTGSWSAHRRPAVSLIASSGTRSHPCSGRRCEPA